MNGHIDWTQFIDDFGRAVLADLGIDLYWDGLPTDYNPITKALGILAKDKDKNE